MKYSRIYKTIIISICIVLFIPLNSVFSETNKAVELGDSYRIQKNYEQSLYWYKQAADQGSSYAMYYVGIYYKNGTGTEKNISNALYYFEESAKLGDMDSQFEAALIYFNGDGVEKNLALSFLYFLEAANQGHSVALHNVGFFYEYGLVPSKSLNQAVIWYKKSAEKGYSGAKKRLDELGVEIPKTSAKNMAETIFFLSDDLKSGIKYFNKTAKAQQNNSFLFNSPIDRKKIMYARPENYTWSNEKKENTDYDVLTFPNTNGYAYLERLNDNDSFLFKISETKYRLIVDGSYCVGDNCLTDENIISVVMPKRFKVISYKANVDGDWKIVDSTYTYYAQNIKGVTLTIEFEDLFAVVYDNVFQKMKKFEKVEVENKEGEIQVRMPLDNVFQPGEISIKNNQAKEWIKQLASSVVNSKYKEFRVEGHADSIPLKKGSVYPSNWELSAARAAVALRLLIESGVPSSKLAAVGYGDSRPIGDNKTSTGRAKNRRIEFKIIPES